MSKFQIRSPLLLTAAMALAPGLAFAGGTNPKHTTTTTSPQGSGVTVAPTAQGGPDLQQPGSAVLSPSTPPDMKESETPTMNRMAHPDSASIDPAQVQKVFGRDASVIDLKSFNKEQLKLLQQRLQERGFYRGKVDGVTGPQTRNALTALISQQYALNQRLINQGQLSEQLAASLGIDLRGRVPVSGMDRNDMDSNDMDSNDMDSNDMDSNDMAGQPAAPPAPRSKAPANVQSTMPTPPPPANL